MNFSNLERFAIHLVLFWKICNKSLKCQIGFTLDFWFHNIRFNFWRRIKPLIKLCGMWPQPGGVAHCSFMKSQRRLQIIPLRSYKTQVTKLKAQMKDQKI